MAYTEKAGSSVHVRQGNTGKILTTFGPPDAQGKAEAEVERLHAKNKPKTSNRGAVARKREKANDGGSRVDVSDPDSPWHDPRLARNDAAHRGSE